MGRIHRIVWSLWGVTALAHAVLGQDAPRARVLIPRRHFQMTESDFNRRWLRSPEGGDGLRAKFEHDLASRIAQVDHSYDLSKDQIAKLRLAARGDIKRFFDRVEADRAAFRRVKDDPEKLTAFLIERQERGSPSHLSLFDEGSLFSKALATTLVAEQLAKHEAWLRQKYHPQYWGAINRWLTDDQPSLGWSREQAARFMKLLLEETEYPRKFGENHAEVVLIQASTLPEARLREFLDDAQWRALAKRIGRAKRRETALREAGYLP